MRYSTVPAIDLEQHIARNRELITALPPDKPSVLTWNPKTLKHDCNRQALDLFIKTFLENN
jgi:hypothetical protein